MRRLLLGVVLVLVLGAQTQSPSQSSFDEGLLACHRGDHAAAMEIWRPLAKKSHAAALMTPERIARADHLIKGWKPQKK